MGFSSAAMSGFCFFVVCFLKSFLLLSLETLFPSFCVRITFDASGFHRELHKPDNAPVFCLPLVVFELLCSDKQICVFVPYLPRFLGLLGSFSTWHVASVWPPRVGKGFVSSVLCCETCVEAVKDSRFLSNLGLGVSSLT